MDDKYVDYDSDSFCWGIFDTETGFCYGLYVSEEAANETMEKRFPIPAKDHYYENP